MSATSSTPGQRPASRTSDRRSVASLLALVFLPWSVQVYSVGGPTLVFAWGLVSVDPRSVTPLWDFLRLSAGLPEFILAWPASALLYVLALASAVVGWRTGREDARVTAGLLVFAGIAQVSLARGFSIQPNRVAYPVGTILLWAVAAWYYWPLIRSRIGTHGG